MSRFIPAITGRYLFTCKRNRGGQFYDVLNSDKGFPDSSVGKESACNAGDPRLIPGSGRSTGKGIGYPLQYSWASLVIQLVESASNAGDLGSIPGLGRPPGEGKGYPLQYSGLKNSMDCIVHGVAKNWTQLSDFHFQTVKTRLKWNWRTGNGRCRRALLYEAGENPTQQQPLTPQFTWTLPGPAAPAPPTQTHHTQHKSNVLTVLNFWNHMVNAKTIF